MTTTHDSTRRTVMAALAALPLGAAAAASNTQGGEMRQVGSRTLVAYFSRSGNTRVVAGLIHRARGTDLFEIRPARPYPEDYEQTVELLRIVHCPQRYNFHTRYVYYELPADIVRRLEALYLA